MKDDKTLEMVENIKNSEPYLIISVPPGAKIDAVLKEFEFFIKSLKEAWKEHPEAEIYSEGMTIVKPIDRIDVGQCTFEEAEA